MSILAAPLVPIGTGQRARWWKVRTEVDDVIYEGQLCVPDLEHRVSDVLCDERPFWTLIEVSISGKTSRERFLAINRRRTRTLRILN